MNNDKNNKFFITIVCIIAGGIIGFFIGYNTANIGLEANWITAIATAILASSIIITIVYNNDYFDNKRREKTIEIMQSWQENLDSKNSAIRKLAENLTEEELQEISCQNEFTMKKDSNFDLLKSIFEIEDNDNKEKVVSSSISSQLRWELVMFLNKLEIVCLAWHDHVVDRKSIEMEFRYIFQDGSALKKFRNLSKIKNNFPYIEAFEQKMEENNKNKPEPRRKL